MDLRRKADALFRVPRARQAFTKLTRVEVKKTWSARANLVAISESLAARLASDLPGIGTVKEDVGLTAALAWCPLTHATAACVQFCPAQSGRDREAVAERERVGVCPPPGEPRPLRAATIERGRPAVAYGDGHELAQPGGALRRTRRGRAQATACPRTAPRSRHPGGS